MSMEFVVMKMLEFHLMFIFTIVISMIARKIKIYLIWLYDSSITEWLEFFPFFLIILKGHATTTWYMNEIEALDITFFISCVCVLEFLALKRK